MPPVSRYLRIILCHMEVGVVGSCMLMSVVEGKCSVVFGTNVVCKPLVVYPYYAS